MMDTVLVARHHLRKFEYPDPEAEPAAVPGTPAKTLWGGGLLVWLQAEYDAAKAADGDAENPEERLLYLWHSLYPYI